MKRRASKLVTRSYMQYLHIHQKPIYSMAQSLLFTLKKPALELVTPLHIPFHQKLFSILPEPLIFTVKRSAPELVTPSKPTPHQIKLLSDIDDQDVLRIHFPLIQFYKYDPNMKGKDPVDVIRKALAKTLVFYYPFAGRLREDPGRKLKVDCNDKGVLFIEADADVSLKDFGDTLLPPFPFLDEVLYDVPGSSNMLNAPLILIQVTRLKCGGFIFAIRINHTMSDASGMVQFMSALAEISRGMNEPSISPVWCREFLSARNPPRVTCYHPELEEPHDNKGTVVTSLEKMVRRTFFFGPIELASIRSLLPTNQQQQYTKFELITAFLWRFRTKALQLDSNKQVSLYIVVNGRSKFVNLQLPNGYYGNVIANPAIIITAGELVENTMGYALNLIENAKAKVTKEYFHSLVDLIVIQGRLLFTSREFMFVVSDARRLGFGDVDFGWGKAVYGGPASDPPYPSITSFYIPFKIANGEEGLVVPICLPEQAMERFVIDLDGVLKRNSNQSANSDTN